LRIFLIFILTIFSLEAVAQAQNTQGEWYNDFISNYGLDTKDSKPEMIDYDFSELFLKTSSAKIYGVIGDDMQRIQIKWISINKDPNNPENYYVFGKTKVKANVCEFTGILKIKTIRLYPDGKYDMPFRSTINPEKIGVLFCDYTLTENSKELHVGVFQGISATDFYLNNDTLSYNDLRSSDDDMTNNQFVGTWTAYKAGSPKICNWGDYRVPNVTGFDCGAAEFSPCEEFVKNGWGNFKLASTDWQENEEIKNAREIENDEWWK